ncbi:MAG: YCF48-related protein [Fibrobacterota bacterium]|nr:YCF48-related protein [Fibrobacterota bacterium]
MLSNFAVTIAQDNLSVFGVDGKIGYVGGGTGFNSRSPGITIRKTEDGGATWIPQVSGAQNSIHSLFFLNSDTGWAVGKNPILKTLNGGKTWKAMTEATGDYLYSVFFTNEDTGWVVGYHTLLKTIDGGTTWNPQSIVNCCDRGFTLNSVYFIRGDTGYAVGKEFIAIDLGQFEPPIGLILKTTDGGVTWNSQPSGTENSLNSVCFGNKDTGWVVGDSGMILHTVNGGLDWKNQFSGTDKNLNSVSFKGTSEGWAVGDSGTILKTTDGGEHWNLQLDVTNKTLRSISLVDSKSGWIAGDNNTLLKVEQGTVGFTSRSKKVPAPQSWVNGVFHFSLPFSSQVNLELFGTDGKRSHSVMNGILEAGEHTMTLPSATLPSGIYLLRFTSGYSTQWMKVILNGRGQYR